MEQGSYKYDEEEQKSKNDKKLMSKVVSRLFDNKFTLKLSSNNIN